MCSAFLNLNRGNASLGNIHHSCMFTIAAITFSGSHTGGTSKLDDSLVALLLGDFTRILSSHEIILVGAVVDRLEGNTQGKAAVFGLLHNAGLKIPASPGDKVLQFLQRLGHLKGDMGRCWSRESDIPKWWVSKSRGADDTEQW
eukprot:174680_1